VKRIKEIIALAKMVIPLLEERIQEVKDTSPNIMVYRNFLRSVQALERGEFGPFVETMCRQMGDSWEWRDEELDKLAEKLAFLAKDEMRDALSQEVSKIIEIRIRDAKARGDLNAATSLERFSDDIEKIRMGQSKAVIPGLRSRWDQNDHELTEAVNKLLVLS
jgi:hypothetical protein